MAGAATLSPGRDSPIRWPKCCNWLCRQTPGLHAAVPDTVCVMPSYRVRINAGAERATTSVEYAAPVGWADHEIPAGLRAVHVMNFVLIRAGYPTLAAYLCARVAFFAFCRRWSRCSRGGHRTYGSQASNACSLKLLGVSFFHPWPAQLRRHGSILFWRSQSPTGGFFRDG